MNANKICILVAEHTGSPLEGIRGKANQARKVVGLQLRRGARSQHLTFDQVAFIVAAVTFENSTGFARREDMGDWCKAAKDSILSGEPFVAGPIGPFAETRTMPRNAMVALRADLIKDGTIAT